MPNLFVIAGPNGAGKTTYAKRFLPEEMRTCEFVNADLIAAGLSPFAPDKAAYEAGRIMLNRLRELTARREDFSFETTLSGRAYAPLLKEMRAAGYYIRMDFLWIPQLGITRQRVRQRVAKGGHDIPDEVQQRRFHLGIRNLSTLYRPLIDHWRLYDNTHDRPYLVADEKNGLIAVVDAARLAQIEQIAQVSIMPDTRKDNMVGEPAAYVPCEETRRSMRAMRKAYADAVLENLRFGLPIIQYRDGQIVEVPAEDLAPQARRILEANGELLPEEIAAGKTL
ncbi:MAG: AAA family ATPase [Opitutaceae bacterium]|jgi:predicted ABC-type ATPase